jgi:translation initiation factor IF-2/integrin beta 8
MEQVTNYVQQAVNVPVTQYRAVYSTKYVQMQPGAQGYGAPAAAMPAYQGMPAAPAASQFAAPIQTTPQAWGSAGADIPQQIIQGQSSIAAPTLPQGFVPQGGVPQPGMPQPAMPQSTFQPQIVPQNGTYAAPLQAPAPLQPTAPPAFQPTPSLKPIPDMRSPVGQTNGSQPAISAPQTYAVPPTPNTSAPMPAVPAQPSVQPPSLVPGSGTTSGTIPGGAPATGPVGMPVVPGTGPGAATGAFPRLLEPTSHTTSWQSPVIRPTAYPTAALPGRLQ